MRGPGDHYGCHRVVGPHPVFPQSAERLDVSLPIYNNEILVRVERLNIDAASFHQMLQASRDLEVVKKRVMEIVRQRGKMHNPVTNSGGTLLGTVEEVGKNATGKGFQKGDRIGTLVSLTLTPLHLEVVDEVDLLREQFGVKGYAILFESGIAHRIPADFSDRAALALFDVCGAPALVAHLARVGETVVVFGAGKSGVLAAAEARRKVGRGGKVLVVEKEEEPAADCRALPFIDAVFRADLADPRQTMEMVSQATNARMADLVVNCVTVPGTEMASVLAAKRSGTVLFFNMATSFQAAVLGAEGIGHETRLIMGNGYTPGHADLATGLVREFPELKAWFVRRFG